MKSILSFIFLILFCIFSCHKKGPEIATPDRKSNNAVLEGVSVSDYGFLVFENRNVFESCLGFLQKSDPDQCLNWNRSLNFKSLACYKADSLPLLQNKNQNCLDPVLLSIINNYGIIQIGEYLYLLQYDTGYCITMHESHISKGLKWMIQGIFDPAIMNRFALDLEEHCDYDAIDLVESGICGFSQDVINSPLPNQQIRIWSDTPDKRNHECKVIAGGYFTQAFFYKSLYTEIHVLACVNGSWIPDTAWFNFHQDSTGSTNCFFESVKENPIWKVKNDSVFAHSAKWRPYCSSYGLHRFELNALYSFHTVGSGVRNRLYCGVYKY